MAENYPAHRTICDFRGLHLDELSQLLVQVVTDEGQRAYGKRKWIVELPNGWIKAVLGFRPLSMRGLKKVQAQFKRVCLR